MFEVRSHRKVRHTAKPHTQQSRERTVLLCGTVPVYAVIAPTQISSQHTK